MMDKEMNACGLDRTPKEAEYKVGTKENSNSSIFKVFIRLLL